MKLETAYLVQSLRQPYDSLNSSYDSLRGILSSPHGSYGTIILTEDYEVAPREFASDPVRLAHDLRDPGPSNDDLLALADAVREAARPPEPAPHAHPADDPSQGVRRGHLRVLTTD